MAAVTFFLVVYSSLLSANSSVSEGAVEQNLKKFVLPRTEILQRSKCYRGVLTVYSLRLARQTKNEEIDGSGICRRKECKALVDTDR